MRDGITVFTGKAELGQGIKTALMQVAAEELAVETGRNHLRHRRHGRTPNEGYTAGSQSMQDSATAIRHAAAQARDDPARRRQRALRRRLPSSLTANDAVITAADGRACQLWRARSPDDVARRGATTIHAQASPAPIAVIGKPLARVDIPAKVTGGVAYVQDLRLPGMVHARVVRPPSYGARLRSIDARPSRSMPGVLKVVRDGSSSPSSPSANSRRCKPWMRSPRRPVGRERGPARPGATLRLAAQRAGEGRRHSRQSAAAPKAAARALEAVYYRPYQMHGSIGPSCAVAAVPRTAA